MNPAIHSEVGKPKGFLSRQIGVTRFELSDVDRCFRNHIEVYLRPFIAESCPPSTARGIGRIRGLLKFHHDLFEPPPLVLQLVRVREGPVLQARQFDDLPSLGLGDAVAIFGIVGKLGDLSA